MCSPGLCEYPLGDHQLESAVAGINAFNGATTMSSFRTDFQAELVDLVSQFEALANEAGVAAPNYTRVCRTGMA